MALLLGGLTLVVVAERVVVDPSAHALLGWAGGLSVLAATVWRAAAWRRATGRTRRAERALLMGHAGVLASLLLFDLQSPAGLTLLALTNDAPASVMLTTGWLITLLTSLSAVVTMERAWLGMPIGPSVEPQRLRSVGLGAMGLALGLVFVFGVNVAATHKDITRDVTFFKTTQPSETSLSLVSALETPVTVILFFAATSDVLPQVRPYFEDLERVSAHLHVVIRDQALEPELAQRYHVASNGAVVLLRGTLAHALDTASPHERLDIGEQLVQARRTVRKLDASFQRHFSKLTRLPRQIRFTTGHQERSKSGKKTDRAGDRLQTVHRLLTRFNIGSDGLGLGDGLGSSVPSGTTAVIVAGPRRPFLEEEVRSLERYVDGGGRLLLLLDPVTTTARDGLDPLLQHFGLRRLPGTALSSVHHMRSTFSKADRALVYSNTFGSHPSVATASRNSLRAAALLWRATTFERVSPAPAGSHITFPIRSSADFWRDLDGDLDRGPGEALGRVNLMATVRTSKKMAKSAGSAKSPPASAMREGRLVVIGDGDFVTDARIKAGGNAVIFIDSLRWLMGEERVRGDLTDEEDVPIEHRTSEDRVWFYATTFAIPLPLLLLGLWIGRRRRNGGR